MRRSPKVAEVLPVLYLRRLSTRDFVEALAALLGKDAADVRLEDDRLCTLVMIGVRPDGTKELITVEDGYRESAESWKMVLRDLKRRACARLSSQSETVPWAPRAAVRDVWTKTRGLRDWFHKLGNTLDKIPKRLQPRVKAALHEVMYAETREQAR